MIPLNGIQYGNHNLIISLPISSYHLLLVSTSTTAAQLWTGEAILRPQVVIASSLVHSPPGRHNVVLVVPVLPAHRPIGQSMAKRTVRRRRRWKKGREKI